MPNPAHLRDARDVAIVGAGPAGLASAAWARRSGFRPVLFELADRIGGQWNAGAPASGVWPGMRANTSRVLTAFSDLDHPESVSVFPTQAEVLAYLERYAESQGVADAVRLSTRVERIAREGEGWRVVSRRGEQTREEVFARVIVASGRYVDPDMPDVPGLDAFEGAGGVRHSFDHQGAAAHVGRDVLVAGCSISALEIACEAALGGARSVTLACRKMRWVAPKLVRGVPNDLLAFTRFAAIAGSALPPEATAEALKAMILDWNGSPAQVGAPAPDENVFAAGVTMSQHFLPLVAEGRIRVRPWIERVAGREAVFSDGSRGAFDAIVMGTGFRLSLPFLDADLRRALGLDEGRLDLRGLTFHPALDGLAFVGLYAQVGPYFPTLELQARWVAYAWSGRAPAPSPAETRAGLAAPLPPELPMHVAAAMFAAGAGVEPDAARFPELERALLLGPLSPASYRLQGPDALPDAVARVRAAAAAFRRDDGLEPTGDEPAKLAFLRSLAVRSAA